jgi:hypothetical protein
VPSITGKENLIYKRQQHSERALKRKGITDEKLVLNLILAYTTNISMIQQVTDAFAVVELASKRDG